MEQLRDFIIQNKLTLLHPDKLFNFYNAILVIKDMKLEGVSAELGAYKGGSSLFISKLLGRTHYVFDTFEGIPNSGEFDQIKDGAFNDTSEEKVRELLIDTKSVIVKGWFTGKREDELFCISCRDFLNYFYKNTVRNGYLFFDDFGLTQAPGVSKAVKEFLRDNKDHQRAFISANHQFCIIK